jgi:D-apionolactonase
LSTDNPQPPQGTVSPQGLQPLAGLKKTIVLDDDPTGTQTVHDVAVLTRWNVPALVTELRQPAPLFFILTNTRALPEPEARQLITALCQQIRAAAAEVGVSVTIISRGDSTLRGHFPAEPEAIEAGLERTYDAWFLIPFFAEGGRITRNNVQYVQEGDALVPVAETPFARDPAFGFTESDLTRYVAEKTHGRIAAEAVVTLSLDELRNPDTAALRQKIAGLHGRQIVVVNAETMSDLAPLVLLINQLPEKNFLFRTAASWVRAVYEPPTPPRLPQPTGTLGGLVVVGSYVPKTTDQLAALIAHNDRLTAIELNAETLLSERAAGYVAEQAAQVNALITSGQHVVVYTSRAVLKTADPAENLRIGKHVSGALVALVQQLTAPPRFLVAKGGITSSDLATGGLGIGRAVVRGQLLPGVPVWEAGAESRFPGLPYIVFPGNVGDRMALRRAFEQLTAPHQPTLRAGGLTLTLDNGSVRYIRAGGRELLRSIYFALRDENWGTIPYRISHEEQRIADDSFELLFEATHYQEDTDVLRWQVGIVGTSENMLTVSIEGEVLQPFRRNRAGFCVLHPILECAGQPVSITQPDGTVAHDTYPLHLDPERFFPYIQAMHWQTSAGAEVRLAFEGDAFETEDQRNFGDGSYKTFCTPLAQPFPVQLMPGDKIQQRISLTVSGLREEDSSEKTEVITLTPGPETYPLPAIGTLYALTDVPISETDIEALQALHLAHLRAEIDLDRADWADTLLAAATQAGQIGAALFVSLTVGAEQPRKGSESLRGLKNLLAFAAEHQLRIAELLLFQRGTYGTPTALLQQAAPLIRAQWPDCQIGAGVQSNYTELARNRFEATDLDFVSYAFQPQEHAFDNLSLIENSESQTSAVASARALYPGKRVYVSPVTLRKRFNPYALDHASRFTELPEAAQTDPRLGTEFGAGWTLNVLKTIAEADADALTLFRATGPLGIVQSGPLPVYTLLQTIAAFRGGQLKSVTSSGKLAVNGLLLTKADQTTWLIANHTPKPVIVRVPTGEVRLEAYEIRSM